jgi:hypothetical protein
VAVDPATGVQEIFAANMHRKSGPASYLGTGGLERPIAVKFNSSGDALYIVDFGILKVDKNKKNHPQIKTGVIWKITRQ